MIPPALSRYVRRLAATCGAMAIATSVCATPAQAQLPIEIIRAFGLSEPVSAGRDLADIQRDLLWIGLYRGMIDGQMGSSTDQAIRGFQTSLGNSPTGSLSAADRQTLTGRAEATRKGMDMQIETSEWTGIRMGVPRGYVDDARVDGEDGLDIMYEGRAAVPFRIRQMRFSGSSIPGPRALADMFVKGEKNAEVISTGIANGIGYFQVRVDDLLAYTIYAASGAEVRGVTVAISASESMGLLPVMAEVLSSTDLFAGEGVGFSEVRRRLGEGRYPGMQTRPDWFRTMRASGSGSLVSTEGHVLTNHHVIGGCSRVTVNGQPADLVGSDTRADLALLRVPRLSGREPIAFRRAGPNLGEGLLVMGYPVFSITQAMNVTEGVLSSTVGYEGSRLSLQITAPVQPGNSGGPVLDLGGHQIAVVASKAGSNLRVEGGVENMAWVVRAEVARDFLTRYAVRFREAQSLTRILSSEEVVSGQRDKVLRVECH